MPGKVTTIIPSHQVLPDVGYVASAMPILDICDNLQCDADLKRIVQWVGDPKHVGLATVPVARVAQLDPAATAGLNAKTLGRDKSVQLFKEVNAVILADAHMRKFYPANAVAGQWSQDLNGRWERLKDSQGKVRMTASSLSSCS